MKVNFKGDGNFREAPESPGGASNLGPKPLKTLPGLSQGTHGDVLGAICGHSSPTVDKLFKMVKNIFLYINT